MCINLSTCRDLQDAMQISAFCSVQKIIGEQLAVSPSQDSHCFCILELWLIFPNDIVTGFELCIKRQNNDFCSFVNSFLDDVSGTEYIVSCVFYANLDNVFLVKTYTVDNAQGITVCKEWFICSKTVKSNSFIKMSFFEILLRQKE